MRGELLVGSFVKGGYVVVSLDPKTCRVKNFGIQHVQLWLLLSWKTLCYLMEELSYLGKKSVIISDNHRIFVFKRTYTSSFLCDYFGVAIGPLHALVAKSNVYCHRRCESVSNLSILI